jgi:hypothetical protein
MPHTEERANNTSSMSSDASRSLASRSHQDDGPHPEQQIRGRAYELYVERGCPPGDGVEDWLRAEREFYERL